MISNPLKKLFFFVPLIALMLSKSVQAHCPLCTIGVAAAAGGAVWLGVDVMIVGIFAGAFAVSTAWWMSKLIKKRYFKGQTAVIVVLSFLLTIIPIMPLVEGLKTVSVYWFGDYGSIFNRTYLFNSFLSGAILGALVVCVAPWISSKISKWRQGKIIPYQGVMLTVGLLIVLGVIVQLISMK